MTVEARSLAMGSVQPVAILVSPDPLDAYPPVQHQAALLARAGFAVEVVTVPLPFSRGDVEFSEPGVGVHQTRSPPGGVGRLQRIPRLVAALRAARRAAGRALAVEIAYDPIGMLVSDLAPHRPQFRIAHFHECLQRLDSAWLEGRLRKAAFGYAFQVAADPARAELLRIQLGLPALPMCAPNYPLLTAEPPRRRGKSSGFEVIYCGALGVLQKLDLLIVSVRTWPAPAKLTLLGNSATVLGERMKRQAQELGLADRVSFEGWVPYRELSGRLARADLGILMLDPSFEQFRTALGASNKRYQYMQAGLPQIGDMNPGVPQLLEGQGIGTCIRTYTAEELARVVTDYVNDPTRRRREGARAFQLHQANYNYERGFEPVLERILQQARMAAAA